MIKTGVIGQGFFDWGFIFLGGYWPSIKYVTLLFANLYPLPPVTLCHTFLDPPKVRHTSRTPPIFSRPSTNNQDKRPLYKFSQLFAGFCPGEFLSIPPSVTVHLLQQKVKHRFTFHV